MILTVLCCMHVPNFRTYVGATGAVVRRRAINSCAYVSVPYLAVASSPGSFLLPHAGGKEPGNVGGFKPLTSGGSDRAPPIRLQNKITWMRDSLKAR